MTAGRRRAVVVKVLVDVALAIGAWAGFVALAGVLRGHGNRDAMDAAMQAVPLAIGITLVLAAAGWVAWRGLSERAAAVGSGLVAGWFSFTGLFVLAGTPYGIGGPVSDCGRTMVAAARLASMWGFADGFYKGLPSQYPPLYFWLWAHFADVLHYPTWRVMGLWQGLAAGGMVLLVALAWRLAVGTWRRAFVATVATASLILVGVATSPCKSYESGAFLLALPLFVAAARGIRRSFDDGGLGWPLALVWGLGLGICFLTYQISVIFALPGFAVLFLVWLIRSPGHRVAGLLHAVIGGVVFTAIASLWLVPYLLASIRLHPGPRAADSYMVYTSLTTIPGLTGNGYRFEIMFVVIAGWFLALAEVRRRQGGWLAQTIVALILSAILVQAAAFWLIADGGESLYSYRSVYLVIAAAGAILALTAGRIWRSLTRRGRWPGLAAGQRLMAAGLVLVLGPAAVFTYWMYVHAPIYPEDTANPRSGPGSLLTQPALAYRAALPNCGHPVGLAKQVPGLNCYPVINLQRCIDSTLGKGARPILLAADDRASAFIPYYQVLAPNAGATGPLDDWNARYAWMKSLAATKDPQEFARRSATGPYGSVDGFALPVKADNSVAYIATKYGGKEEVDFDRAQFPTSLWNICEARHQFIAIRKPGVGTSG